MLAEENTNIALRFAHYGYILESGRVVTDGAAGDLAQNKDVKEFYRIVERGTHVVSRRQALSSPQALARVIRPMRTSQ